MNAVGKSFSVHLHCAPERGRSRAFWQADPLPGMELLLPRGPDTRGLSNTESPFIDPYFWPKLLVVHNKLFLLEKPLVNHCTGSVKKAKYSRVSSHRSEVTQPRARLFHHIWIAISGEYELEFAIPPLHWKSFYLEKKGISLHTLSGKHSSRGLSRELV